MTRTFKGIVAAGILAFSGTLVAQQGAPAGPEINFDSADLLKWDDAHVVGEVGGVGQDSRGRVYVYTRTGHAYATLGDNRTFQRYGSRLFQYDAGGKFGKAGKAPGEFATIHQMDCRDPNVIYTAEINDWRSQKILLKPQSMKATGNQGN